MTRLSEFFARQLMPENISRAGLVAVLVLALIVIMLTQLRVAGYVSMDRAYYPTILIGIIHFLVALAVAVKTRNAAWYAYVIAIPIAFIGMGAVTPIGAVWGLAYMTYWFWL